MLNNVKQTKFYLCSDLADSCLLSNSTNEHEKFLLHSITFICPALRKQHILSRKIIKPFDQYEHCDSTDLVKAFPGTLSLWKFYVIQKDKKQANNVSPFKPTEKSFFEMKKGKGQLLQKGKYSIGFQFGLKIQECMDVKQKTSKK